MREWPDQANGFALPIAKEVCRYATPTCWQGCYAKRGRMAFSMPQRAFAGNYRALLKARTAEAMAVLLVDALAWIRFRIFRIHVGGDFFSLEYAEAWRLACREYGVRRFWSYTRSRDERVLGCLAETPNLRILLSCDRDNWRQMLELSERFPGFGLSYYTVGETPADRLYERGAVVPAGHCVGLVVFPDSAVRKHLELPGTCPTERAREPWPKDCACVKCGRCCG